MKNEFIITDKQGFEFYKQLKNVTLTRSEAAELIVNKEIFKKFLTKTLFSYQLSLATGQMKGEEDKVYMAKNIMEEVFTALESFEKQIKKYEKEQESK